MNFLRWTREDWIRGAGARLEGNAEALTRVTGFSNDSRKVGPGDVFIALPGEKTDGHAFVRDCLEKGAAGAVVSEAWFSTGTLEVRDFSSACLLVVRDPLLAMVDLAAYRVRKDLQQVLRIGITGSNGKTTTKEILRSLFEAAGKKVFATAGNFNSDIGLPIMVMATPEDTEVAVYEMGMNRAGEMDLLVRACSPTIGVVTNIGRAHIGILGSQQAIAVEKRKVFHRAEKAVVWAQDSYRDFLLGGFFGEVACFSSAFVEKWENRGLEGCAFTFQGQSYTFPLPGRHNLENALAALAVGKMAGLRPEDMVRGLAGVKPVFGRSEIFRGAVTILQDCYNANLDSMTGLLEFFAEIQWDTGRKYLVLGSMKELGVETENHHRTLGILAAGAGADALWFFGEETELSSRVCSQEGALSRWCATLEDLESSLLASLKPGDLVAVKGSRGVQLERIVEKVRKNFNGGEE